MKTITPKRIHDSHLIMSQHKDVPTKVNYFRLLINCNASHRR